MCQRAGAGSLVAATVGTCMCLSLTWLFCIKFICEKSFSISLDLSSTPWQCLFANSLLFNSHERQTKCILAVCRHRASDSESTLQSPPTKKEKKTNTKTEIYLIPHTGRPACSTFFFHLLFISSQRLYLFHLLCKQSFIQLVDVRLGERLPTST